jgi:ABC-type glycerol-3-phosphate transport system permease component
LGARVAGLTAAFGLRRQGFAVTVVERMALATVRTSGHAADLFGPAVDVVERAGMLPAIPVTLAAFQDIGTSDYGQLITATVIFVLPVAARFLLLQRYFVAGLLAWAVKQ